MRKFSPILIACTALLITAGCAVEGGYNVSSSNLQSIEAYLPVQSGYEAFYDVTYSDGRSEIVRYSVGEPTQLGSENAHEWVYTSSTGAERVSFIQAKSDCILIYDPSTAATEKILQLPLEPGASWARYSGGGQIYPDNSDGDFFDFQYVKGDTSVNPGGVDAGDTNVNETNKNYVEGESLGAFPTDGALEMQVEDVVTVELKSGKVYTKAIRISNAGNSGRTNYYWYVAGAGLVKYAINAQGPDDGSGQIVGELVSFSR